MILLRKQSSPAYSIPFKMLRKCLHRVLAVQKKLQRLGSIGASHEKKSMSLMLKHLWEQQLFFCSVLLSELVAWSCWHLTTKLRRHKCTDILSLCRSPIRRQLVQPLNPLYWLILRAAAVAGIWQSSRQILQFSGIRWFSGLCCIKPSKSSLNFIKTLSKKRLEKPCHIERSNIFFRLEDNFGG